MATLARLNVVVGVEDRTKKGFRSIRGETEKTSRGFTNLRSTVSAAVVALAALAGAAFATKKIFDLGAAVGETASKFNTVFGPAVEDVSGFLADFANMAGLSAREAEELAGTTGALIQGFGFTRRESAALSEQVL